jgi:hypothetical protein
MIPKGISHTSVQNPMNFKKEIFVPFRKILVPFSTVILAGHFYWFSRFVPSSGILRCTALGA